ncbi:hypothetical protein ASD15_13845 [Massilia sp. Root351]|jgi:hypothetical protein|uniref:DUF4124 domain-containing protein n=1 Tax=Massilia sp. Root351 TaxID=1736522 RepID=UPI00070EF4CC|nr:DUF4124 domain-containing protein [Massilia sp. Root351]KQV80964.1 hypothetical protein ASD15_13845 [Massilia sp. Root351]
MKHYRTARALSVLLALAALPAWSHAQYMWLDEKGMKQLSDQPPPPSVPQNRILKQPSGQGAAAPGYGPAAQSPAPAAEGDAPDAAESKVKRPPTVAERNAEFAKRKAESQAAEQKAAQEAARKAEQAANCDSARSNQAALDSGTRMTEFDKSGQRVFLSDEQRAERSRRNQKILAECSKK